LKIITKANELNINKLKKAAKKTFLGLSGNLTFLDSLRASSFLFAKSDV
jgi:hypothetical protein